MIAKHLQLLFLVLFLVVGKIFPQNTTLQNDSVKITDLQEVIISAAKTEEKRIDIAQPITLIKSSQIRFGNFQTTGDVLQNLGNVFVQRSQMGGGSPVIRGFEANKVLIVIDGIRMNNAIYRGGHLQNIITLDPNILERIEVLNGTGAVMYGSDAIGGVMSVFTKNPLLLNQTNSKIFQGNAFMRYSSANNEKTIHTDFNVAGNKWASLTSVTMSDFDDLRKGSNTPAGYEDFGRRYDYITQINGLDTMLVNNKTDVQLGSAYRQADILQKFRYVPTQNQQHILNLQFSTTSDVPRYDRLTDRSANRNLTWAEWYYGPQTRFLASYQYILETKTAIFDKMRVMPSYQFVEESRYTRRFKSLVRSENVEQVNIYSLNVDFQKQDNNRELRYGIEINSNYVGSSGVGRNILTNAEAQTASRYPDRSRNDLFGVYFTENWEITPQWVLNLGLRYSYTWLTSSFDTNFFPVIPTTQPNVSQKNGALSHQFSIVGKLGKWRVSAVSSSGFRSPNLDDMAKFFVATQIGNNTNQLRLTIPNPNLSPEKIWNHEIGLIYAEEDKFQIEGNAFYSRLLDAMVIRNTTVNGQISTTSGGKTYFYQTNTNTGLAEVWGFSGKITAKIIDNLSLRTNVTYTWGRDLSAQVPLDHIPPLFMSFFVNYTYKKLESSFYCMYNGWKNLSDYSPSGEDNLKYATNQGMPEWYTLNFKTSYQINQKLTAQAGVENILDASYRTFSSGIHSAGRNFIVNLRINFYTKN
jgi:hemoglobin/transferrin/lactoferrin receptor protein